MTALSSLAAYGSTEKDIDVQIVDLIADLLQLSSDPEATITEARQVLANKPSDIGDDNALYRKMNTAQDVAADIKAKWQAARRSLGSLRGNITRADRGDDLDRVARLRSRELLLMDEVRLQRHRFVDAATAAQQAQAARLGEIEGSAQ